MADSKPYGNVAYGDPKNGKYPIDTAAHAKSAWSYVNMPKNAAQYPLNGVTLASVKARIKSACAKFGIAVSDTDGDTNSAWADQWVQERFNTMHAPAGSAAGGQFAPAAGSGSGSSGGSGKGGGKGARPTPSNAHPVGQGETGKRVSDLQSRLNALGAKPPLKLDGIFGPKTLAAVKAFQKAHGLKVDGLVGPKTTAALRLKAAKPKPAPKAHTPAKTAPAKPAAPAKMVKHMTHFAPDLDVVRSTGGMELQPSEDGTLGTLTGRFSEFGRWYKVSSKMEGDFLERVSRGATADTIRDNRDSMRVLFDHGMDAQIGNKVLGPIDVLEEKSDGPHYEVPLFDTSYNRDLLPGLKAGVYGASMRMRVTGDEWDDKPTRSDANPDGLPERTITRMKVLEFGPVTFPANPGASAGVRSGTDEFYHRLRQADAPAFEDALRACGLSAELIEAGVRAGLPLEDFTGRDGARSAPGGDEQDDVQPGNGGPSPTNGKAVQRDRAWRIRRQLDA